MMMIMSEMLITESSLVSQASSQVGVWSGGLHPYRKDTDLLIAEPTYGLHTGSGLIQPRVSTPFRPEPQSGCGDGGEGDLCGPDTNNTLGCLTMPSACL